MGGGWSAPTEIERFGLLPLGPVLVTGQNLTAGADLELILHILFLQHLQTCLKTSRINRCRVNSRLRQQIAQQTRAEVAVDPFSRTGQQR